MNTNDGIDPVPNRDERQNPSQGSLLLQFALIGSGRVSRASPNMQLAAAAMVEEVIDAATLSGRLNDDSLGAPMATSSAAVYSLFDWLDAVCSAAGADVVDEIFTRLKPQYLQ
jgi:hypothetical protein